MAGFKTFLSFFCFFRSGETGSDDKDDAIRHVSYDGSVGHGEDRREVKEDVVVFFSHFFQDVAHLLGTKDFGWVRRDRTTGQDIKVWKYVFVDDFVKGEAHGDDVG